MRTMDFITLVAQRLDDPYSRPEWKLPESRIFVPSDKHEIYISIPKLHSFHSFRADTHDKTLLFGTRSGTISQQNMKDALETIDKNGQAFKRSVMDMLTLTGELENIFELKTAEGREA